MLHSGSDCWYAADDSVGYSCMIGLVEQQARYSIRDTPRDSNYRVLRPISQNHKVAVVLMVESWHRDSARDV